jgi:hypothetical protein
MGATETATRFVEDEFDAWLDFALENVELFGGHRSAARSAYLHLRAAGTGLPPAAPTCTCAQQCARPWRAATKGSSRLHTTFARAGWSAPH